MLENVFKINVSIIKTFQLRRSLYAYMWMTLLIMSKDVANLKATKCMLARKFDMKDLGVVELILEIKIHKTPRGLALSHSHYIGKVLENFKYLNFKRTKTPIDVNLDLAKNKGKSQTQLDYTRVFRNLMYVMNCTRQDIICAISELSRYTTNPNKNH